MTSLVDTNVLVYRFDSRFPRKQEIATDLLRTGISNDSVRVPHQAIVEFAPAVTRPVGEERRPMMSLVDARREAEEMLSQFDVLYPTAALVRLAIRGSATYQLSCFDAHIWACAELYGMSELLSEDFQHGRLYGTVRARNPFIEV